MVVECRGPQPTPERAGRAVILPETALHQGAGVVQTMGIWAQHAPNTGKPAYALGYPRKTGRS